MHLLRTHKIACVITFFVGLTLVIAFVALSSLGSSTAEAGSGEQVLPALVEETNAASAAVEYEVKEFSAPPVDQSMIMTTPTVTKVETICHIDFGEAVLYTITGYQSGFSQTATVQSLDAAGLAITASTADGTRLVWKGFLNPADCTLY